MPPDTLYAALPCQDAPLKRLVPGPGAIIHPTQRDGGDLAFPVNNIEPNLRVFDSADDTIDDAT